MATDDAGTAPPAGALQPKQNKRMVDTPIFAIVVLGLIAVSAFLLAWNIPTSHSAVTHHSAVTNAFMSTRAYDSGADFYLFNRCKIFVVVDGAKYTAPGEEQNDECVLANPADALKLTAYTRADSN